MRYSTTTVHHDTRGGCNQIAVYGFGGLVSRIRSCADKLGGGWELNITRRTAKRDEDDGRGKDAGLRLLLLAAVIMAARALSSQTNRQTSNDRKGARGENTHSSTSCDDTELHFVLSTYCEGCGVFVGSVLSFFAQPDSTHGKFLMHPLAVLLHLRPRFAYILDYYGHARGRRRASAHRGEAPL